MRLIAVFATDEDVAAAEALLVERGYSRRPSGVWRRNPIFDAMKKGDEADDIIDREEAADLQREQEKFYERESGAGPDRGD